MLQQLAPQYVPTGKAKIVYHNFPIIGPGSVSAAQAAECAASVQQQLQEGQQRGVQATPTFFINGQEFEGLLSYDQLVAQIQAGEKH